ncbi:MAG: hypothetical protein ACTSU5_18935 [Promethearchaeota archaeon]
MVWNMAHAETGMEQLGSNRFAEMNYLAGWGFWKRYGHVLLSMAVVFWILAGSLWGYGYGVVAQYADYLEYQAYYEQNPYEYSGPTESNYAIVVQERAAANGAIITALFVIMVAVLAFTWFLSRPPASAGTKASRAGDGSWRLLLAVVVGGLAMLVYKAAESAAVWGAASAPGSANYVDPALLSMVEDADMAGVFLTIFGVLDWVLVLWLVPRVVSYSKAQLYVGSDALLVPPICLYKDPTGNPSARTVWTRIPFPRIVDVGVGESGETFGASRALGTRYYGNYTETTIQKSTYRKTCYWLVLVTEGLGTFGIPVKTDDLARKTANGEHVNSSQRWMYNKLRTEAKGIVDVLRAMERARTTGIPLDKFDAICRFFGQASAPRTVV